ncbi:transferrin receptor-like dimerization domain-containing protein [uncultured Chitinophaga sp.]|jgi:Predicted aminopeptidases|uniref:transferrin receptor-like dimerization domain-containing protein n=1 Tax=uncultured Chitinophaga sp. TaxID=339340 RepID=UPI002636E10B|nr:transferrin receptor-like dimerization domain-containing protein [uncultured Chitinophaga sp.]
MRRPITLAMAAALALGLNQSIVAQEKANGTKGNNARLEADFDQQLSSTHIGENIKAFSAKPHNVGAPEGKVIAEKILNQFKSYGWDARIETYQVLFPTPKTRVLEMTGPTKYTALLKEPALKEDATSGQDGQLPTYNAWSGDGNVTAQLVYVNYGLPADYEQLERLGIDVKGKIVIARYGRSWRGIKPKVAAEHGAIGCIIYSDPKEDGYYKGDVYPRGAFKNEHGVQRGSVMDMVIYPGDPLTPGIGATANAKRLERTAAPTILKIPVLPISYHDAQPLLAALEGPVVPEDWRGALPVTYHTGPGKATVHLQVESNWNIVAAHDVIATIKGAEYPDQWVVRGNHHDAWVNGAGDPVSGLASMLEEAKAIGALVKNGYKPKRTLVYCAWDGEEPGLLGSTEWVEDHAAELQQKAVAYINTDGNGRGFLGAGGSHALTKLMDGIAKDVTDPQTQVSIYERLKAAQVLRAVPAKRKEQLEKKSLTLGALGSGSDYSPFFQHLGIPSLNLGFGGEDDGGEYHSVYDSYDDYTRFKDPGFHYGVALSKVAGRAALRLADADVLPFDFSDLYKTIHSYVKDITDQTDQLRESTLLENRLIKEHTYQLAADPTKPFTVPAEKDAVPYIDFSALQNALVALDRASAKLADSLAKSTISPAARQSLNEALYKAEQSLLTDGGLPRRSWYKHTIYAPGFYTGYGVKTLPGVREAIEQRNWKEAREQIQVAAAAVNRLSAKLDEITTLIR